MQAAEYLMTRQVMRRVNGDKYSLEQRARALVTTPAVNKPSLIPNKGHNDSEL